MEKNPLLENIAKLHTTKMGLDRIRKNLGLRSDVDPVDFCKEIIMDSGTEIFRQGKNWYCQKDGIKITVNSYSYTIITAHKIQEEK